MTTSERRAARLVRWYPRAWRESHGQEFAALLEDSLTERPLWPARGLNVAVIGLGLRWRQSLHGIESLPQRARGSTQFGVRTLVRFGNFALRRVAVAITLALGVSIVGFALGLGH